MARAQATGRWRQGVALAGCLLALALPTVPAGRADAAAQTAAWRLGPPLMQSATRGWISLMSASPLEISSTFAFTTDGGRVWPSLPPVPGFPVAWLPQGDGIWVVTAPLPGRGGSVRLLWADMAAPAWRSVAALRVAPAPAPEVSQWRVWRADGQVGVARLVYASELPAQRPVRVSAWRLTGSHLRPAPMPVLLGAPLVAYSTTVVAGGQGAALDTARPGEAMISVSYDLGGRWSPATLRRTPVGALPAWPGTPEDLPGGGAVLPLLLGDGNRIVGFPGHLAASAVEVLRPGPGGTWTPVGPALHLPLALGGPYGVGLLVQSRSVWWLTAEGPSVTHPRQDRQATLITRDGGRPWHPVTLPRPATTAIWLSFAGPRDGLLVAGAEQLGQCLLATTDGGRSWHRLAYHVVAASRR